MGKAVPDRIRSLLTKAPFEKFGLALFRGVKYGGFWSRFIPMPYLYRPGNLRSATRGGIDYELDPSCLMQWYIYWGFWEKQRERLYSMVNSGDIVLDVGTNVGETLFGFAKHIGPQGFVYGFEPDPTNYSAAMRNLGLNRFSNIKIFNFGLSDKTDSVKLFTVDANNRGMNRILSDDEADGFSDFSIIETRRLDDVAAENGFDRLDLIKIDIEGYEMHALRGAAETLRRFRPKLFIEVGYTRLLKNGTGPNELVSFLEGLGYETRHAETDELIDEAYDFSPLGDGGIDVYAIARQ